MSPTSTPAPSGESPRSSSVSLGWVLRTSSIAAKIRSTHSRGGFPRLAPGEEHDGRAAAAVKSFALNFRADVGAGGRVGHDVHQARFDADGAGGFLSGCASLRHDVTNLNAQARLSDGINFS